MENTFCKNFLGDNIVIPKKRIKKETQNEAESSHHSAKEVHVLNKGRVIVK